MPFVIVQVRCSISDGILVTGMFRDQLCEAGVATLDSHCLREPRGSPENLGRRRVLEVRDNEPN